MQTTTIPVEKTGFLSAEQVAHELDPSGAKITARTIRRLFRKRQIPGMKLGYRTLVFNLAAVKKALENYVVREVR